MSPSLRLLNSLPSLRSSTVALPPAPYPSLLNCNDPPTTEEQWESIHTAINRAKDVLKGFNDQNDNPSPLNRLPFAHNRALSFIQTHQNVVSPIRRIPSEIWSTIFHHYATSIREQGGHPHPQFVLARVCRRWRDIVYGSASLWIRPPPMHLSKHGARATKDWSLFKSYINRATGRPLTLDIISGSNEYYEDCHRLGQLASFAEQWGDLTAKLSIRVLDPSSVLLEGKLVNLRKIDLTIVGTRLRRLPEDLFVVSTKLTDVALWTIRIGYWPVLPPQVLRFECACNSYKSFYQMIQHAASSLEQCALVWAGGVSPDPAPTTAPLTFPNLRHLNLQGYTFLYDHAVNEFISQITLPNLESLTIELSPQPEQIFALAELFTRSTTDPERGHGLHTLSVRSLWWWDMGTRHSTLFRQTPNVVELHVNFLGFETWDELTHHVDHSASSQQPDSPLLPKLTRLFIYKCRTLPEQAEEFVRARTKRLPMVDGRREAMNRQCADLEFVVMAFKKEKACQKAWENLDRSVEERKTNSIKLRSLSGPLYNTFKAACANGRTKALAKILKLVENDSHVYDIRSIMDSRLPSVLRLIANSGLPLLVSKRAQDILDSWGPQIRTYSQEYHWHRYPVTPEVHAKTKFKVILVYHRGMQYEDPENPFVFDSERFSKPLKPKWRSKEYENRYKWDPRSGQA
ncbi:hypothetical protein AX16_007432 [Volvariella volvacea WC 439]|nr:hypothetical protein AX16_007432 [Volvariella volvacea WC 439]